MYGLKSARVLVISGFMGLAAGMIGVASAEDTPANGPAPSAQQGSTSTAPVKAEPAQGSPEEVVCRREEATTGTMLGRKKICKTRKEWDDLARDSQEALRQSQEGSLRNNSVPDGGSN